jgi:hypothetical protein
MFTHGYLLQLNVTGDAEWTVTSERLYAAGYTSISTKWHGACLSLSHLHIALEQLLHASQDWFKRY